MLLHDDVEPLDQIRRDAPMNATGATGKPRMPMPPLRIVPLDNAGFPTALFARKVLLRSKEPSVGIPEVRRNRFIPVIRGNVAPGQLQHFLGSSSDREAKNMFDDSGNGDPQPKRRRFSDAKLVELDRVAVGSWMRRQSLFFYTSGVFLRMARTVFRLTLNV
jgi:hypothetical protein